MSRTIKWGILAPGGIAKTFSKDLLVDPSTRGVTNIKHTIVAVASSSSVQRSTDFIKAVGAPESAKAYGNYKDLVNDPDVEIIYVASPHSHHYQHAMLCLESGKNVLCEKSLTVNAEQTKLLIAKAKEKNLFFMEAVWTRYFPIAAYVREIITSGKIGQVTRAFADNSFSMHPEQSFADNQSRMVNPDLAGGVLLDLGIYSLTWLFIALHSTVPPEQRQKPDVASALKKYPHVSAADEMSTVLVTFHRPAELGGDAHGVATTSMRVTTDPDQKGTAGPAVRIQGSEGEIQLFAPAHRPTRSRLFLHEGGEMEEKHWPHPGPGKGSGFVNGFGQDANPEGEGHGMFWEADEAGFALLEGRKEGRLEGWDESLLIMEVMDEVRRQGGMRYPENIESTEFPLQF